MKNFAFAAALALAGLIAAPAAAQAQPAAQMGESKSGGKAAFCIGCHGIPGYKMAYPVTYSVPLISGQSAKYIENALQGYKAGDRKHPTMRAIAASLSDADIKELAAYYGTRGGK